MHQALYRKWRPQTFDDVYGQEHITSILKYETENNKFSHAYLFCGSRGTGKTTCAKILAKAVNCESPINGSPCNKCASCRSIDSGTATDVLEMDAASNNGVDNIRDIRDEIVYTPSSLKYRVYIVDEVHMLSGSAFNALLKTLEEPPAHAVFILATTELHKLPSTIISRCQRHDFRRIATDTLVARLSLIADKEEIAYDPDALRIIAKMAQGGMRDAISLLELCAGSREKITSELVNSTLGVGGREGSENVIRAIAASDYDRIFGVVEEIVRSSKDISVFVQDLIAFYRDMLVAKTAKEAKGYLDLTDDEFLRLAEIASLFTKETLLYHCRVLDETLAMIYRAGTSKRTVAEMALIKMCDMSLDTSADALLARISKLENAVVVADFSAQVPSDIKKTELYGAVKEPACESEKKVLPSAKNDNTSAKRSSELKLLRGWSEICDNAAHDNGAVLGFLKMAKALTDGTCVYIRFPNDFARSMVDTPDVRESLRNAVCRNIKKNLSSSELVFGVLDGNEDSLSDLDEFEL